MSGVQAMMQPPPEQAPQDSHKDRQTEARRSTAARRWAAVAIKGKQQRPKGVQAEASNAA